MKSSILGIILMVILMATNPNENQLKEYIKKSIKADATDQGGLGGALNELFAGPQTWLMTLETNRKNFYLFSFYTVSGIDIPRKYIGVFNTFFAISR